MRGTQRVGLLTFALAIGAAGFGTQYLATAAERPSNPTYTAAQAAAGKEVYMQHCMECHGDALDNGQSPPLMGSVFQTKWGGKNVYELYSHTRTAMPAAAPGSLTEEQYVNVLAYIFQKNILLASPTPLKADMVAMKAMVLPAPSTMHGQLEPGVVLPPPPPGSTAANPLDKFTAVTEAMLKNPGDGDWLTWRRTQSGEGYSPLKQINKSNVAGLKTAWSWSLPNGANESTPLVHDGVIFVYGYGDAVQALNAANGDLLWEYQRVLPKGTQAGFKKALAIYGDKIFMATGDAHMVALNAKTGDVIWDTEVAKGTRITGGPLVAKGKVMIGTGGSGGIIENGGGSVVAFDIKDGKKLWTFKTIAQAGEPGGDTWNDLPAKKRSGGTVWTPGSYDPDLNLAYFGTAQTYDTGPLRDRIPGSKSTNDMLYTDSTLAFNPDTGKLVWYFQHMPNDQWDLDWAYERQLMTLPVNGVPTKVVVTAGKPAIHDVLDAKTGKFLFSIDLGLQNFIKSVDPKTGAKIYDETKIPGDGKVKFVCPHVEGAKNWIPSAYNPSSHILYVALIEACMYMTPVAPGENGLLTTGVRISLSPPDGSDGNFGRLQAINLETKQTVWVDRQRAPRTSGVLSTAGGLVFAGSLDRMFTAYDEMTGKKMWSTRLNDVMNSSAVTYAVNGKQYIAVITGLGGNHSKLFMPLAPEIKVPVNRSSTLWVFELPSGT